MALVVTDERGYIKFADGTILQPGDEVVQTLLEDNYPVPRPYEDEEGNLITPKRSVPPPWVWLIRSGWVKDTDEE